ncbi:PhnD/SsuA/transferrin family substrate-binding protein [Oceanithermus profundus]|uniref:ABC transporter substrate-binding protein n=1 Tax=Oceanithermus profundus (strain DSM 14977 / NBRC 100410 / VKM B-2274 / 506) TaxID=670487 RepID=E4U9X7_OCEP5|nr:PhnD/SsuA/transferrin family substrate-binding protein [Oceanithermus profundus]ADR37291.1 hypothetical protein Ocepr_1839 [Oceanithermus profundus DSM 14977]
METPTLTASACPHDTAKNLPTWIEFFLVLGQLSGLEIGYAHAADFPEFYARFDEVDLVYANPLDAVRIERARGFLPVAMSDNYDEVVFVAAEDTGGGIAAFAGQTFGAVEGQFATLLAQTLLHEEGVSATARYYPSWGEVLAALRRGEVRHAVLYKDFYAQLEELSLEGVCTLRVSDARRFAHLVMLAPERAALLPRLREGLEAMARHPLGRLILDDLRIGSFRPLDTTAPIRALQPG